MTRETVRVTPRWWGGYIEFLSGGGDDPRDGFGLTTTPRTVVGSRARLERVARRRLHRRAAQSGSYELRTHPSSSDDTRTAADG